MLRKLPKLDLYLRPSGCRFFGCALALVSPTEGLRSLSLGIYVAGASARYQHYFHSVGSGRTSPPVRRRDPFPACRSTRGVVDGSRTFGNRVPHGSWSSSVGPATVLPLSAGDGGTMRDPIHVASRFFPVSFPCETLQSPHRLGRARVLVRELGTGAAASIALRWLPCVWLTPLARERRRCCSAPLYFAARHFGSATCIGNPPDPS